MFLSPERKIIRKIKELILAMYIERKFSKEEILQFYLNQIYFGEGAYGVEAAAKVYFNKPAQELNLAECAMLAGLPRAPSAYSPENNIHLAYKRRAVILRRLRTLNFITEEEEIQANSQKLPVKTYETAKKTAPYFVEDIRKTLLPEFGANMLYKGGLRIYTTLDLKTQQAAEEVMDASLKMFDEIKQRELKEELMEEQGLSGTEEVELSTSVFQEVQGALIAIDPRNGQIRAMVGGRDFEESEFNRVTQAYRQPGSGFKPFIYTAAIDNGFTPATILKDEPRVYYNDGVSWKLIANTTDIALLNIDFSQLDIDLEEEFEINTDTASPAEEDLPEEYLRRKETQEKLKEVKERLWSPQNYYPEFSGDITLRNGIVKSINCATVDLLERIRPVTALYYAKKMGIRSRLPQTLSLALGSGDLTPLELCSAFCVFANQGIRTSPYAITKIEDFSGNILTENFPKEKQVLSPRTNYIMINVMQQVCEYGTGWYMRRFKRPHAGKTGTTNDFSDAWFTGFTLNLAASVWVGYDDHSSMGKKKAGGVVAAPIWTKFMNKALAHTPALDFPVPKAVTFVNFDPDTGKLATEHSENAVLQPFIEGTEPREYF
jgi:penicillin-binding protein 1A